MKTVHTRVPKRAEALETIRLFDMGEKGCFVVEGGTQIPVNDIGNETNLTAVIRKLGPEGFYCVGGDENNYQEARRLAAKHAPEVVVLGYRKGTEYRMSRTVLVPDQAYKPKENALTRWFRSWSRSAAL